MALMSNTNNATIYLGVDGGGSTCRARLRDHKGQLLGEGTAGPANLRLGAATATAAIQESIDRALSSAGLDTTVLPTLRAGIGLAGAVLDEDMAEIRTLQSQFAHCTLNQDAYIACLGAHSGEPGGIVIVGTGSCAQIICPQLTRTYGGWGNRISDHASGAWLGRKALRYALQALEQLQPSSAFTQHLCDRFDHRPAEMLRWSDTAIAADYAAFAPFIFDFADRDDPIALALVDSGCQHLGLFIKALAAHNTGKICLLGGLAQNYRRYLPQALAQHLCAPRGDALDGALLMAGLSATAGETR